MKATHAVLCAMMLLPAGAGTARAAHYTVNSTNDSLDSVPGDGVCSDGNGRCTLRAAILEANAHAGSDIVTLQIWNTPHTLSLAGSGEDNGFQGDLDITGVLYINAVNVGPAAPNQPPPPFHPPVIDGGGLDRVFDIRPGAKVNIRDVVIRHGDVNEPGGGVRNAGQLSLYKVDVTDNDSFQNGAGVFNDTAGVLDLKYVSVSGNQAASSGGGVANNGTLTMYQTTVRENWAANCCGGIVSQGVLNSFFSTISDNMADKDAGGLGVWGTTWLDSTTVARNEAGDLAGGIENHGVLSLTFSTVDQNTSGSNAGGILNTGGSSKPEGLEFYSYQSTISRNHSGGSVGGILHWGTGFLVNTTVSGNTAEREGVGISVASYWLALYNSTVTGHRVGAVNAGWPSNPQYSTAIYLANTIIAGNSDKDCDLSPWGTLVTYGHNLDRDGSCQLTAPGDQPGTDPKLGPLQNNTGPTQTHALLQGSPAIDGGDNQYCPTIDQRGVPRPAGAACDIGAYEYFAFNLPGSGR